jgi:hypothetical protein
MIPLKNIKNTKGKLTLGFDPKINMFLVKAQNHFLYSQPEVKQ